MRTSIRQSAGGVLPRRLLLPYTAAQLVGAVFGGWLSHAMLDMPILQLSTKLRTGTGQWLPEAIATFGLLLVILRAPPGRVAALVAVYIGAAYWFTASTSFANPAATVGRMFSGSFAGIAPGSVSGFVGAQLLGAAVALIVHRSLHKGMQPTSTAEPEQPCRAQVVPLARGPNMMVAMPARLTATPTQSVVVGRTLSTSISQTIATPM